MGQYIGYSSGDLFNIPIGTYKIYIIAGLMQSDAYNCWEEEEDCCNNYSYGDSYLTIE
jgi:hypothetical protein